MALMDFPANFNPRSPRGERPNHGYYKCYSRAFQSTLPSRGATIATTKNTTGTTNFNPRSPRGERRSPSTSRSCRGIFQSTLPSRGATDHPAAVIRLYLFQSTLPSRGATRRKGLIFSEPRLFQSTLPSRGATAIRRASSIRVLFQSTLPSRGATVPRRRQRRPRLPISIHAPLAGSDWRSLREQPQSVLGFQSTLPSRGATILSSMRCCPSLFQSTLPSRGATRHHPSLGHTVPISIHAPLAGSDLL